MYKGEQNKTKKSRRAENPDCRDRLHQQRCTDVRAAPQGWVCPVKGSLEDGGRLRLGCNVALSSTRVLESTLVKTAEHDCTLDLSSPSATALANALALRTLAITWERHPTPDIVVRAALALKLTLSSRLGALTPNWFAKETMALVIAVLIMTILILTPRGVYLNGKMGHKIVVVVIQTTSPSHIAKSIPGITVF